MKSVWAAKSKQPVLRSLFWCVMPKSIFSQELTLVGVTTKICTLCLGMWNPITEMNRTTYANTWSVWLRFNKNFPWENRVGPIVLIKAEQGLGPLQYFFTLTHGLKPMTTGTCPEGEKKNKKEFGGFDCFLQCLKGCWPTGKGPRGRVLEQKEQDWVRCVFSREICPIWCVTFATQASDLYISCASFTKRGTWAVSSGFSQIHIYGSPVVRGQRCRC